ncbi:hypothetical protein GCM10011584_10790 [Nocardioides phosphati]|uniref:DUF2567 domain-containing protein n=1 Tax=Nocardioides phosphati TaxID=1867775 RepID=A0ABQ2N9X4_9ACTN|nr:hypothetical protein [Nocardioides phosphati]GGO87066.1 hypothetical protein GCM10011584_10790 [Nocardioides phosphati]
MKRPALLAAAVVIGCALLGALCGVGWWLWWKPAPSGVVYQHHAFFMPDEEFRATGLYVAIAAPVGLLLGVLGTWRLRRDPLLAVLVLVAGAVAGGAVMLLAGRLLEPASALALARHAKDGAAIHASLRVDFGPAWCAMPFAAVVGCLGVLLSIDPHAAREMASQRS